MRSAPLTQVLPGVLLVFWAYAQQPADGAADGCDCGQLTLINTDFSERLKQSQMTNSQQADKIFILSSKTKRNSASVEQLSEQINNLTAQVGGGSNDGGMEKEVTILSSRIQDADFKHTMRKKRVDRFIEQLNDLSEQVDRVEAQLERASSGPPRDCSQLPAGSQSGLYLLQPIPGGQLPVHAFCDLDSTDGGGGWTVIQRRGDFGEPRESFHRDWSDYRRGFGDLTSEFWWGLDNMWATTSATDRRYELRIDLEDRQGAEKHAAYRTFRVSSEADGYRLTAADFSGDAGDSLGSLSGQRFTTLDNNLSRNYNCARGYRGGWWYKTCRRSSNLNGVYLADNQRYRSSVLKWPTFSEKRTTLKTVTMKIRPVADTAE